MFSIIDTFFMNSSQLEFSFYNFKNIVYYVLKFIITCPIEIESLNQYLSCINLNL